MLTRPSSGRSGRSALLTSAALASALLACAMFLLAFAASSARADVTPTLTSTYANTASGGSGNLTMNTTFAYSNGNGNGNSGDDIKRLAFDWPAGMIGDPNAITSANRCNIDYTGVTPTSGSPDYSGCPAASRIGTITVTVTASAWVGECDMNMSGNMYLLRNRPVANPEVPTYVGIHLSGVGSGLCSLAGTQTMDQTVKISLRPSDTGLRLQIIDDLPRDKYTGLIGGTAQIRILGISQVINGTAPSGLPFLKNPTRCTSWVSSAYARAWDTNTNVDADIDSAIAGNDHKTGNSTLASPNCGALPAFNPGFTLTPSTTAAGQPTGFTATLTNTIANPQPSHIKRVDMTFPLGYQINPAIANKVGSVGCTTLQFNEANPDVAPTCPAATQVGTVSITTPLITGAVTGQVYLGQPLDATTNRYRLMVYAANGAAVKFEARANVAANGQVTVVFGDAAVVGKSLPQFPWSQFQLVFFSGADAMMSNPQVCGSSNAAVSITPWTNPTQAAANFTPALTTTAGPNAGGCSFDPFAPTFTANVSDTGAAKHPNLSLTVTRGDRQDNIKDMTFTLPNGMGGSLAAAPYCSVANLTANTCAANTNVGTVAVTAGQGAQTISLNGNIYLTTPDVGDIGKLGIVVPAVVGPFDLGNVVMYTRLQANSSTTFGLTAYTQNMPQIIDGIPIHYRSIALTLSGIIGSGGTAKPFIQNPGICGTMNFGASIGSAAEAPAAGVSTVALTDTNQSTTGCAAGSPAWAPTMTMVPSTTETAKPTGLAATVNIPYTSTGVTAATVQSSTLKRVQMTFPAGMEINPAFTVGLTACTTADIDAGGGACAPSSKIGTVTVTSPLLTAPVSGDVILETPGATGATRYKLGLVIQLPGRSMVIHGTAQVNGSSDIVGGLGAVNSGTGQVTADFPNLPDVPMSQMILNFNSGPNAMFTNPETCGAKTFPTTLTPNNAGGVAAALTPGYTTTYDGVAAACPGSDPWNPAYTQSVSTTVANAHPNLTMTVTRTDKDQDLNAMTFGLPAGLTGAPANVPTCTQANADAATCAAATQIGTVAVGIGSGASTLTLNGTLNNTVSPGTQPAKFTVIVPVVAGPFNLGSLTIPVNLTMRADYGLDATVASLPQRYEGVPVRYRSMQMVINGIVGGQNFMTNPSKCQLNTTNTSLTSTVPSTVVRTASYTTTGCPVNFGTAPTFSAVPTTTAAQTPTGFAITVGSAATNPTIKRVQVAFPAGTEINPAVGNGPLTACATATIDAGGAGCPATSIQGTVSITTPLLTGSYTGNVYLETPGATAATRYKLAIVVNLPGRDLIIHGGATVNGSTTIAPGGTGASDSGTGQVIADFDNIPDLSWSSMTLNLNSGNRALLINPTVCSSQSVQATITPNSGGADATPSSSYTPTACSSVFTPTFAGSVSTAAANGHPNLTMTVTSPDKDLQLRNFNVHLPTGLVANTTATTQCTQAVATAGNCVAGQAVGTVSTTIGNGAESYALSGTIYNVVPNASEPARLQAVIPVTVGPFDLGKLSIPVGTSLRADYGVDANTQLPLRYEGIAVRIRSLQLVLNGVVGGNNFMTNPSKCQSNTVSADMISPTPTTVTGSFNFTTTGCPINYGTAPTLSVTPSTTASQTPVGLTIGVNSAATNVTTKRIQLTMPTGMEVNPAFGNGPLAACAAATVDAGGAGCPATSNVGTVTLNTPLLPAAQTGNVYLETPGATATTRYKLAIVVHLPGRELVVRGAVNVNGSSTIAPGGTGASDSGTGQVTADFDNIPDLGFTNMTLVFNSGNRAMLINPTNCAAQTFNATITPNSGGVNATPTANYTTTTCASTFAPTFSGAVSTTVAGGHPNVTLTATSPDKDLQLRNFNVHLPTGLVANTTATTQCLQATATAGNCTAAQAVGTVNTSIGNGGESFALAGTIYNVVPNAGEPARFQAVIPVTVGPFDLGKLSIPVPTSLRADLGVDTTTQLPLRYEGIAVRIRSLQLVLNGVVGGNNFMTNPSKCQSNTISADMISPTPTTVTGTFNYTTTGCPVNYGSAPTLSVTPSTTVAQTPVGLTIGVNSAATNVTTKRIQLAMPTGMEVNPAFGNGPLAACAPATVDAGGAGCPATSNVGTVSLTTPLLPAAQTGNVYLETPGATATTRYKLAIVVHLPGRELVVRGAVNVNGSSTIAPGGTGASDSGTGQVSADFDNIPDLGFTNMTLVFNSGNRAMLINPTNCAAQTFNGTLTPNSGGTDATPTANYTTTACTSSFAPTFAASVSTTAAGGHPNLTLTATSPDKDAQIRDFNVHLPTGLVANTTATTQCAQATATAGNCTAAQAVGTVNTSIGNGGESFALSGTIYNVVPNASEPARLQAVIPVAVGPFDLGKLSIPVGTSLRPDFGVDTTTQLPLRYEGIAVRIRSLQLVLNGVVGGNNFMTNPSKCQSNSITADMISPAPTTVSGSASYTTTGCAALTTAFNPSISASVNPTAAAAPTALTFGVNVPADSSSVSRVQLTLPQGMEINPGVGNGLLECTTAQIDAGGAACAGNSSNLGTITLNTPLLPTAQTGNIFLESRGSTAATRYKLALVIHLPGRELVVHGSTLVNGSSTIAPGGTGSVDSGTGQVTADFNNLPDLGFTSMTVAFNTGGNHLFVNPEVCSAQTVTAGITPNSGSTPVNRTANFTPTGCPAAAFNPTFTGSVSTTASGAHPNLTLNVTRGDTQPDLRNFNLHLPTGLVANTSATSQCSQANAAAANCAAGQIVGSANTTIGSGSETYALSGSIYNVVPNANEPARLQAIIPVNVGPFDLGSLTIPVTTSLRADMGVDANAQLPLRYEGIAVHIRSLQMVLSGTVSGNPFITNPSKCQSNAVSADMISETPSTVTGTWNYTTTGCPLGFGTTPAFNVTPSTTESQKPVGLTFGIVSSANNPTISRIQMALPAGMEVNPAFGNSLVACSTAQIDAGGALCNASSNVGTVSLTTPLLPAVQTGNVYLETPGTTAGTRYKLAIVIHLPGRDLIVRGAVNINGSSTIAPGGPGAIDSGTGQITADFDGIPDLQFTNMTIAFNSGNRAMLTNPSTCVSHTFNATITPSSGGADATPSDAYTASTCNGGYAPTFSASVNDTTAGAHPNLTLTVNRPEKDERLRDFNLHLPTGLVAATTATATRCSQANAAAANCAVNEAVGTVNTSIGTGGETLPLTGTIYNVVPNVNEPAHLAAVIPVFVGPFDLGKLSIPVGTSLRNDYGVDTTAQLPLRYEGIAVRISQMQLVLNGTVGGNPFITNPSKCQSNTISADMISENAINVTGSSNFTTTGCPINFGTAPTITAAVSPSETVKPTGLTIGVNSASTNPTISRIQMALPAGMEINPAVGNGGLAACATATIDAGGAGCPATSNLGTVSLNTTLLSGTQTGNVYLETPGNTAATRYKLAIVVHLPGKDLVVHGSAQVNGSSDIAAGTGATDSGTGQVTADFNGIPDLGFTNMSIAFNTGNRALLSNPSSCGSQTVNATITPSSGGVNATPSAAFTTSYDGAGAACPGTDGFAPTFGASLSSSAPGAHPNLTLSVTGNEKDRQLRRFDVQLPTGLVAATTATTQCSQANATAGNCAVGTTVGSVTTAIGTGGETLSLSGSIHNVVPNANEPARLQAIIPVVVGPFDLGKLSIPVSTALRPDMGVDAGAQLPLRYEGILVRVRNLDMTLNGTVSGNPFITNPSKCGAINITADLTPATGSAITASSPINITGCPVGFGTAPTMTASVTPSETAKPTGLTLGINSAATNLTIKRVQTTLPAGMSINPAVGNGLAACSTAAINAGGATCPAGSEMGTVSLVTPLLAGTWNGKIFLETPGGTAATRYKLAIVVDLPGQQLVVHGSAQVDGSSDIAGGTGATDSGTGQVTADFDNIPDLGFTNLTINFNTGDRALLTNPETCGSQAVNGAITPHSGGADATPSANFTTSYDGSGGACPGSEGFAPSFSGSVSTTQAAGNPDLTLNVTRADKTEQLKELNLQLPPGLVADTVQTSRCSQANAAAGSCAASTVVGSVTTAIGTGGETLSLGGTINNTVPDANEPARLTAVIPVVVGPYDLGKLSLPVQTTLVSGALPSDLRIDTATTIPQRYEGVPVRIRSMQIVINGIADQGTVSTADDKGFMLNPSRCRVNTVGAEMKSANGTIVNDSFDYTTDNCNLAQFNPSIDATVDTTETGQPAGLSLAFSVPSNSSSVEKIETTLPQGMEINPAIGNQGGGLQACSTVDIDNGGGSCPASSVLGTVTLDTPLLPTQQTGFVYLETPGGTAATRYKLGIVIDLPGPDLIVHGAATVDGSSEVVGGLGATDTGTGQVTAEFTNLPDLQFSKLQVNFNTGDQALLTNPETCGTHTVSADMTPWSDSNNAQTVTDTFDTDYDGAGAPCPGTIPQNPSLTASLGTNSQTPDAYKAGAHADVTMTLSRPDKDQGIRKAKILLPAGLIGSADAAPTCLQAVADAGNCAADTEVGDVTLNVGSGNDTYALTGTINNTVAPSNRPAKLTFAASVVVGPFDLGKVVVPIDVNLDPNDYSLSAETGLMPQRFEGVPVRIRQMVMRLDGYADQGTVSTADDKPFMSNPHSCGTNLTIRGEITSPVNYPNNVANVNGTLPQQISGCENLNLDDDTIDVLNTPTDAEQPTRLDVQVNQGVSVNQATLKDFTIALPGFRLNAPAADGLVACSAAQLDAQTCPANSKVGRAWIDTSLLPVDQTDPSSELAGVHSLWGNVYLETPGTAPDGSDRYKLAIQLSGKTLITIRGVAKVNETTGDITTEFKGLPDIPFETFKVMLDGATNPLLLNPATCGTSNAASALTPWSGAVKNINSGLNVTNCTAHPFAPSVAVDLSTHVSGEHPDAEFTITRADGDQDLKDVTMTLPAGFLGSAASVPQCSLANAAAGNCSSASAVGTVVAKIGQAGQVLTLPGTAYLTDGANGDIAGMSIKVPAIAGPYNLGDYITQGRVILRPTDHGIDVSFEDIPQLFKGVPTKIQELRITLPGISSSNKPFLYNASNCNAMNITGTMTSYDNATASTDVPYQATGCPARSFAPKMSFAATGGDFVNAPSWVIKMSLGDANSTMKYTKVLLPSIMTVNIQGIGTVCEPAQAAAHACPVATKIGDVTIATPLLPAPVTGNVYIARTLTGSTLPDLLIEIPAPINMQIRGANSFFNNIQIQSTFDNLPDLVWSDMTMNIAGGPKGVLGLRSNGVCGDAQTNFASHSGQTVATTSVVTGVAECKNVRNVCDNPAVQVSTKGVKKKGNKKSKTALSFAATNVNCAPIKSFTVLYPKGTKINKKLLAYNKKKKATKKNLKNVTGKAGAFKLKSTDFQVSGKNGLKIKTALPASTRSLTINSINSAVLLPYKTFCGAIKGKGKTYKAKLKKCQAKTVSFTFVVTRTDGTVLRYEHKVKVGDKKFK